MEKQAKRLQERAKNRSETNKSAGSEPGTKAPTQNEQNAVSERTRANSEPGADSEPGTKKRGVKTPQKIYALFCEMKLVVLKDQTPSFWGL